LIKKETKSRRSMILYFFMRRRMVDLPSALEEKVRSGDSIKANITVAHSKGLAPGVSIPVNPRQIFLARHFTSPC
jgi:hypothetical protein